MIQIDNTVVSLALLSEKFACDMFFCKGICCLEGEQGAPIEKPEIPIVEKLLPLLWNDITEAAKIVINKQGIAYTDNEGQAVISIVEGRECVFAYIDAKGWYKCAIEKIYREGKTDFPKPISCHLYPIRLQQYDSFTAVNYHRWDICHCGRKKGVALNMPVYQFLKEPLIRKFGISWFEELDLTATEWAKQF